MTKQDYKLIADSIWRSGFIKDKNKIKQEAREKMRRLITSDIVGGMKSEAERKEFFKACGVEIRDDSELKSQNKPLKCTHKNCRALQTADGEFCEKHYPKKHYCRETGAELKHCPECGRQRIILKKERIKICHYIVSQFILKKMLKAIMLKTPSQV